MHARLPNIVGCKQPHRSEVGQSGRTRAGGCSRHRRRLAVVAALSSEMAPPGGKRKGGPAAKRPQQSQQQQPQQPALPEPQPHQQTLRRSFVVGGIGLHSGEFAVLRVRPAAAGEGRYFVHVPQGTNSSSWKPDQPEERTWEELGTDPLIRPAEDDLRTDLFFEFLRAQDSPDQFGGSFGDFLKDRLGGGPVDELFMDAEEALLLAEEAVTRQAGEVVTPASVAAASARTHRCFTVLGSGDGEVWGPEHLLSALEACGVDNARIEIEGGQEVPIIEGSALGWCIEVQKAGLCVAPLPAVEGPAPKTMPALQEMVTVRDGESFITFYPGPTTRITAGVDQTAAAAIIGRQWFSWSPNTDEHFRWEVAPARTSFSGKEEVEALVEEGMLKGGPDYCSIIGWGDDWYDNALVRFPRDEVARHAVVDLVGNLSLLAQPGGRGLPVGHTVAYQASLELQVQFVRLMQAKLSEWGYSQV